MAIHPTEPIPATIEDLAWVAGRWVGTHGTDVIEEHWSDPNNSAMLGMFRASTGAAPRFYELITFDTEGAGLICRFKHFNRDLSGWEERDEALTFDLVQLTATDAVFLRRGTSRWMTYRRDGPNGLSVFFESDDVPRDPEDEFRFARG